MTTRHFVLLPGFEGTGEILIRDSVPGLTYWPFTADVTYVKPGTEFLRIEEEEFGAGFDVLAVYR